ncbi:hypothetical protein Tco_0122281 [Tanacetum coccineum]
MSFVKRSDAAPVCHSKPLDSVKNWNDHFFWVDSTAFPLSVSLKSKILNKDPRPKLSQYDTQAFDFLRTHTAPFRKFPEPFLCWVGISRYYKLDENCYPTFWDGNEGGYTLLYIPDLIVLRLYLIIFFYYVAEMDLFAFIRHSDPTKVLIGERETANGEVKLLTLTEGHIVSLDPPTSAASGGSSASIDEWDDDGQKHSIERDDDVSKEAIAKDVSEVAVEKTKKKRKRKAARDASGSTLSPKKLREDYRDATSNVGGKSLAAIRGLILEGSSVSNSVFGLNLQTCPPGARYVASLDDSHHSGSRSEVNSFSRSPASDAPVMTVAVTTTIAADVSVVPIPNVKAGASVAITSKLNELATSSDSFYASQDLDSETLHNIYVPKWKVTNDSILDDPYVCRDLTDRLAPPALFSQLRAMDYDQLYTEFNVGAARQMCLGAEVRMRAEHTLEQKDRHEDKCAEQTALLSKKDVDIAHLKSLLSLREAEAIKAIHLRGEKDVLSEKVTTLESVTALKETELVSLTTQVVQLTSNLSGFQLWHDELSSKVSSLESERDRLANQGLRWNAQLLEMPAHLEEELRQAIGCAINKGIRDGLKAGVDHGKAGRDLSVIKAYDPSAKAKYIDAVSALRTVDFSLLSVLKSKKDASIVDLMDSLRLEGPLAEIPRAEELKPSPEQLIFPIHRAKDDVILGEISLSFALQVVHS